MYNKPLTLGFPAAWVKIFGRTPNLPNKLMKNIEKYLYNISCYNTLITA